MCRYFRLLGVVASALFVSHIGSASDIPRFSFNELTDNSELVVSGRITRTWTDWDTTHRYIWTHYELAISATHKGAAGPALDIAEPGGQLDGIGINVPGAAGYRVGDSVLVFLSRMPNGYLRTAGFGQGKYLVDANGRVHGETGVGSLDGMSVIQVGRLVAARAKEHGGTAQ